MTSELNTKNLFKMLQDMIGITNDTCCIDVHKINSSLQCTFVQQIHDCAIQQGLVEYTILLYCHFHDAIFPLGVAVLISWLGFLFIALAVAASDFFCPSLIVIARVLRMSDNIAGITLLAFGNGAPDVFSAIAAVNNMKHGDNGLILGALLGAGVFLTTIVVGVIALVRPFKSMERPFLRDIIFYMLTVFVTFVICFKHQITLIESIGFIVAYLMYVLIVVLGRVINQRIKNISTASHSSERQEFLDSNNFMSTISHIFNNSNNNNMNNNNNNNNGTNDNSTSAIPTVTINNIDSNNNNNNNNNNNRNHNINNLINHSAINDSIDDEALLTNDNDDDDDVLNRDDELLSPVQHDNIDALTHSIEIENRHVIDAWRYNHINSSHMKRFLHAISPVDVVEWKYSSSWQRVYAVAKAPAMLAFKLTTPVVDVTRPLNNWNQHLHALHCLTTTLFALFSISPSFALSHINNIFPVYAIFIIIGVCMGVIIIITSSPNQSAPYHAAFAFIGFLAAVLWIKTIASEIVNILQTIGIVFTISNAILGLTLLAWGNSIGDFISDVSMAKRGFPRAGFSACFGGPLFNTLLGIGIPFTFTTLSNPQHVSPISYDNIAILLFVALAISLLSSLVIIPLKSFKLTRAYGWYLVLLYVLFLVFALLVEKGVISF